jgi:hypothetical protein
VVHEAGAQLLIGTDYGMPYLYAGEAVHQELAIFVEAGLSNEAALASATSKPAAFLGQADQFGSIKPGSRADLILLRDDPFAQIDALGTISSVIARGHWLDRATLDEMLDTGVLPQTTKQPVLEVCRRTASGSVSMLEDFDDGDAFISGDNRQGKWFTFDDGSAGQQTPTDATWTTVEGGVAGKSLHVQGGGFTSWGSGVGVNFAWDTSTNQACGYDVSGWDGISFWAKGNVTGFSVALPELDVVPIQDGGRCSADCYGAHQAAVDLDDCWHQYALTFAELQPPSWSAETGPLNLKEVSGVQFTVYTGSAPDNQFEFWLDEVELFQGPKPAAAPDCSVSGAGGAG